MTMTTENLPRVLLGEVRIEIHGTLELENAKIEAVRELVEFVTKQAKVLIECLSELRAGTRPGEIEVAVRR